MNMCSPQLLILASAFRQGARTSLIALKMLFENDCNMNIYFIVDFLPTRGSRLLK